MFQRKLGKVRSHSEEWGVTLSEGEQDQMLLSVNVQLQRDPRGFQVDLVFCKEDSLSKKKKSTCKSRVFARIKPRAGRIPLADSSLKEIEALTNPSKGTVNRPQVPVWSQLPSLRKAVESG